MKLRFKLILFLGVLSSIQMVYGQRVRIDFQDNMACNVFVTDTAAIEMFIKFPSKDQFNIQLGFSPIKHVSVSGGYYNSSSKDDVNLSFISSGSFFHIHTLQARSYSGQVGVYQVFYPKGIKKKNQPNTSFPSLRNSLFKYPKSVYVDFKVGLAFNRIHNLLEIPSGPSSIATFNYQDYYFRGGFYLRNKLFSWGFNIGYNFRKYQKAFVFNPIYEATTLENFLQKVERRELFPSIFLNFNCQVGIKSFRLIGGISLREVDVFHGSTVRNEGALFYSGIIMDLPGVYKLFKKKKTSE